MKREYKFYLEDIIEAIRRVQEYTFGKRFEDFEEDFMLIDAVLRNLEVIGEAATHVPLDIKERYPHIPWRDIQGFRIIVAHKYWSINIKRVWDIVENKLEDLQERIIPLLKDS